MTPLRRLALACAVAKRSWWELTEGTPGGLRGWLSRFGYWRQNGPRA